MKKTIIIGLFLFLTVGAYCNTPLVPSCFADAADAVNPLEPLAAQTRPLLEIETEKLITDFIEKGYGSVYQDAAGKETLRLGQDEIAEELADLKYLKTGLKAGTRRAVPLLSYEKTRLSNAEALHRVAISDGVITLKEAIDLGLANDLAIQALKKKIEVARSKLTEARRALFPTVAAVVEENGGIASRRFYRGRSYKLNIQQPVYYGGELVMTAEQAEANWKSAKEEYRKARNDFIQQVASAYYGAVKTEYNLQYQLWLHEEAETVYRRVRQERLKKLVSEIDYLNAESQYYQIYFQMQASKNESITGRLSLYQILGIELDKELPVDLKLNFKKINPELGDVLEKAMRDNPDIRMKSLSLRTAELGIHIYRAKKMPRVDLRGSYGMLGEVHKDTTAISADNHDLDLEKEWFLGFGVSMPLGPNSIEYEPIKHQYGPTILALTGSEDWRHKVTFNLFDKLADLTDAKNAEATYLQAQADLNKSQNETIVKVKDEYYNLQKSLVQIDSSIARMRYQEKQVAAYRYLLGLQEATVATLFETMIEHAQSKFSFIQAVADYHVAVAGLNNLIGDPDHFQSKTG